MSELVEFYRARLAEDEQRVEASGQGRVAWITYLTDDGQMHYTTVAAGTDTASGPDDVWVANGEKLPTPARVLLVYDQARALREVEAKRRVLELHAPSETEYIDGDVCMVCTAVGEGPYYPCQTLRLLALPYADHPDYREEWKP